MWIYIEHRSTESTHLFGLVSDSRGGDYTVLALVLQPEGSIGNLPTCRKSADAVDLQNVIPLPGSMVQRGRWSHLCLVWPPGEAGVSTFESYLS